MNGKHLIDSYETRLLSRLLEDVMQTEYLYCSAQSWKVG